MYSRKESGAQCRKRRKTEQERLAKQAGSLDRFIVKTASCTSSVSTPELMCSPNPESTSCSLSTEEADTTLSENASLSEQNVTLTEQINLKLFSDISYWPEIVSDTLRNELVKRGTCELQNKDAFFSTDVSGRSFSKDWFYMKLENGERVLRTWLLYSPVKCAIYCFPCML